jgi:hypothetical protein
MPSPKNTQRTMADVRAECIALGIQPGRSIAECERRIAYWQNGPGAEVSAAWKRGEPAKIGLDMSKTPDRTLASVMGDLLARAVMSFTTPGRETNPKFAEGFADRRPKPKAAANAWLLVKGARAKPKRMSIRKRREMKRRQRQARMTHKARKAAV